MVHDIASADSDYASESSDPREAKLESMESSDSDYGSFFFAKNEARS